jgi:predicted RNA-binding protein YlqC (UPF0109 family)
MIMPSILELIDGYRRNIAMKELIQTIAEALVDHPEKVTVLKVEGRHNAILKLRVAKTDIGKVIGKHGRIADSIRTILTAASAKEKRRTILEILE